MEINQREHIFSELMIKLLGNYSNQGLHYFAIIATSLVIRETNEEESKQIPTACIAIPVNGNQVMMLYNKEFTDKLNDKQLTFLFFHEIFHIILMSNERAHLHDHDPMLVNITHDMVINSTLMDLYGQAMNTVGTEQIPQLVEPCGKKLPFIPKDYKGLRNYESIINHLEQQAQKSGGLEKFLKGAGIESVGEGVGKDAKGNATGETLDVHIDLDKITPAQAEAVDKMKTAVSRGLQEGNIKEIMDKFVPKPRINVVDYIAKYSKAMKGDIKKGSWHKRNRKMPELIRGTKKRATYFNLILDTSGSMRHDDMLGLLGAVMRNGIMFKLIQIDTKVQDAIVIKSMNQLSQHVKEFKGRGGTVLQPALDYCKKNELMEPCVVLTDGYTDYLNFHSRGLVVYTGCESPIAEESAKVTQIKFEPK